MKKIIILTSILLLFLAGKAQVNWTTLSIDTREDFQDISCVNENVTYVCGSNGYIGKTTDGGKTWTTLNQKMQVWLYAIKFIDEQTGFVGGANVKPNSRIPLDKGGIVWKTTDGGVTWQDITPPDSINVVEKIFPIDKDTLYIQQYLSSSLLKSTDEGTTWDTVLLLITQGTDTNSSRLFIEIIMNFYMVDSAAYVTAVGQYTGTKIYKTLDYAKTWQEVYMYPNILLNPSSSDLVFFHPDTVYAYFSDSLLYTTDGFITYKRQAYFSHNFFDMIKVKRFSNGNFCLISYDRFSNPRYYYYGNVNGNSFYEENVFSLAAVDGCNDSIFYVLTPYGKVYTNRYFEPDNAVRETGRESLSVFPNPTSGQLRIMNDELREVTITVYNIMGKKLPFSKAPSPKERAGSEVEIDISYLPAGIYFLRIETEKGIITQKVIKE
jgi:hypothetical protein